jgi:hypothetical protein
VIKCFLSGMPLLPFCVCVNIWPAFFSFSCVYTKLSHLIVSLSHTHFFIWGGGGEHCKALSFLEVFSTQNERHSFLSLPFFVTLVHSLTNVEHEEEERYQENIYPQFLWHLRFLKHPHPLSLSLLLYLRRLREENVRRG